MSKKPIGVPICREAAVAAPQQYNPSRLLNALIELLDLKSDAALARALEIAPPTISKMRHRVVPVSAAMLICMHYLSGLSISELRGLMSDHGPRFRAGIK